MTPFDFRAHVKTGDPFPLQETDFMFGVSGAALAVMRLPDGINCGFDASLQLINPANAIELDVVNDAQTATITALFLGPSGWQTGATKSVPGVPGLQHVRFDFTGIRRITIVSPGGELYLQTIR
jgi:hypothetical protein